MSIKESKKFIITGETPKISNATYYEYQEVNYPYSEIVEFPVSGKGFERFLPLLPIKELTVSLNGKEGDTSVSQIVNFGQTIGLSNLWVKHEEDNPTGCFKDRESAVVISAALEQGVTRVNVASSGNAALSTAAYAQKAGIECICYVPAKTSKEKKILIELFGAKIVEVPGFYEDVYRYLVDLNPPGWNVTSGQNELRTEGNKTIAFEIWEQLGVPDKILVPCGNGGCLAGIWKGFIELKKIGKTDKLPQMIAVQVKDAAPLKVALEQSKDFVILPEIEDSIAEGIVALESYCSPKAVKALKQSGGYVIEVTDNETTKALKDVITYQSLVPEPTSATVYAALTKLNCSSSEMVVCINTGSGMKFLSEIAQLVQGRNHE